MDEILSIKIIFGILLSIGGIVLLFLSFKLFYKYLIQEKKCTNKTKGLIKKYTIAYHGNEGSGIHLPIVFYTVDGKEYKVVGPEYKSYITVTKSTPLSSNEINYDINNQVLKIYKNSNSFIGIYENPIEKLFPIDSEIDVYYDPENPKLSYVLRYCNKKWIFWLTFLSGIVILIINLLMIFFL